MVKLYVRKIKDNEITLSDVPILWREKTRQYLETHS